MSRENTPYNSNILEKLVEAKTGQEVKDLIDVYYPNWIVGFTDFYSSDYPHLQSNWETVCRKIGVGRKLIILVDDITFDNNYSNILTVCELMTRNGYCVRRQTEFIFCETCKKAIPTFGVWLKLKQNGMNVPMVWRSKCSKCN